jgi:hypothetical protein
METIGIIKLNKTYGRHGVTVLAAAGYIKDLPRHGKRNRRYQVLKPMPDAPAFLALRNAHYQTTVQDAIGTAYGEFEGLKDELQEWRDSLPEGLDQADKAYELEDAVNILEGAEEPDDVPDDVGALTFVHLPGFHKGRFPPRHFRHSEACAMLEGAKGAIEDWLNDADEATTDEDREAAEELVQHIETQLGELEGVDFPGMF